MAVDEPVAARDSQPDAERASDHHRLTEPDGGFRVHLEQFEGPFDLLLGLIAKHELDITLVALSKVTDEFIAYIREMGNAWDLGQASEFLVVAATLVDLKAARLLPTAEVEDEEDLALLEVRDLLFARLLQYRAYKQVAAILAERFATEGRRFPRSVGPEPRFAGLLPEVLIGLGPQQFAEIAARALTPKPPAIVSVDHLHAPTVSVREQAGIVSERLRRSGTATFRSLVADCGATIEIVARFLALLELFREALVSFEQLTPLGDLLVRWTGTATATAAEAAITDSDWPDDEAPSGEGAADTVDEGAADEALTDDVLTVDDPAERTGNRGSDESGSSRSEVKG
ncbi:MAG: segregation and condensation protein A [Acidothermaceae bacterium]